MTDSPVCAYPKCRHLAVMHLNDKGSCTWPWCSCRQYVAPIKKAAS